MAAVEGVEGGERKEEDEEEVEEQLVMVELSGIIDSDFLEKCENKCKILVSDYSTVGKGLAVAKREEYISESAIDQTVDSLVMLLEKNILVSALHATHTEIYLLALHRGIETERPILQVDRYVFAGQYEDALGTCVVFEENTEHVDAEGNQKVQLKYKCHTMKKLNMTRTLLTEKKEGEENVDGVEWLQIKDRDFPYSRPNMICSFLHEKEDSDESAQAPDKLAEESEGEASDKGNSDTNCDQAQDKLAEESEGEGSDRGNSDTNCDLEKQHGLETDASSLPLPLSPASEAEGSPSGSVALDDAPP